MDNAQFRNLIQNESKQGRSTGSSESNKPVLGARARAAIPMTPRTVHRVNAKSAFSRQGGEHHRGTDGEPALKKFKSTAAPKGSRLAAGYQDRTSLRRNAEGSEATADDKEKRLKALEEMHKLQQIDDATFEGLKNELGIGGSLESTHLVKGIDWKLLAKIKRGEDINSSSAQAPEPESEDHAADADADMELDEALLKGVQAREHTKSQSGDAESEEPQTSQVVSRDEILRRLKESRSGKTASLSVPEPVLGDRFKKVQSATKSNKEKFVETVNGRRREVLIITNKDGTKKRKTRWIDNEPAGSAPAETKQISHASNPLGMEVPAEFAAKQRAFLEKQAAEDDNDDIFAGVADYDPLAGMESGSDVSDSDATGAKINTSEPSAQAVKNDTAKPRNYFGLGNQAEGEDDTASPITKDPTLLAALKRAAGLRQSQHVDSNSDQTGDTTDIDPDREAKRKAMLARLRDQDRADAADMDLGFGESRFGDDDDEEGVIWDDNEGTKKAGRKRGPKKRKGDKDSAKDVMSVLEGRQRKDKSST